MKIDYNRIDAIESDWKKKFPEFDKIFDFSHNLGTKHLDFGCGIGAFLKIVSDKYPRKEFYGVEIDKTELILADKLYKNKNLYFSRLKNISEKHKFDSVSFFFVLHEVQELSRILKHITDMLHINGKVFVYDFRKVSPEKFKENYSQNKNPNKGSFTQEYAEHNKWTMEEFEKLMQKAGLSTIDLQDQGEFCLSYIGEKKW